MQKISSVTGLKNAIQLLEEEHAFNGRLLKEQFDFTIERLKPINLLKSSLHSIASSPGLLDNMLSTGVGLATGYLTKKIVVRASGNIFRKLIGSVLQLGVTNLVAHHPDAVRSFGRFIFQHTLSKKKRVLNNRDS